MEFFVRCAGGFESILAQELRTLHMERVRPLRGGVSCFGTQEDGYRICLWSRVATRVQLVLIRIPASNANALYQAAAAFPWEQHVRPDATVAVHAHGQNPSLRNTAFTALKVKDALCDRLRDTRGTRPNVDAKDPDFAVDVALHQQKATLYLNLSGASLHRRGYRTDGVQTEAPLKETLAAGILLAAIWPELAKTGGNLIDPFCGSGTFAVEAALMAANVAPGLLRTRWGFEGWVQHDDRTFKLLRAEALTQRQAEQNSYPAGLIMAGDLDSHAIDIARDNARRAGVDRLIHFYVDDAAKLNRHIRHLTAQAESRGLLVSNPPYGKRLLAHEGLAQVNAALATAVESLPSDWRVALITPNIDVDTALGRIPDQVISCYNGPLQTWVRLYEKDRGQRNVLTVVALNGTQKEVPVAEAGSNQFAARFRKVARDRMRWARKTRSGAFRVYDADLPDYALSVDVYVDTSGPEERRSAVIAERRRPPSLDVQRAGRRLADAVALTSAMLDIPPVGIIVRPDRGRAANDEDTPRNPAPVTVTEESYRFALDLNGRPDTGLPLIQRGVRELVGAKAAGTRFACLFATAGATAVYAAGNGAASTTSVDPFADRVECMRANMTRNGFSGKQHTFVCRDVRTWLEQTASSGRRYDLMACAPPLHMLDCFTELVRLMARVIAPSGSVILTYESKDLALDTTIVRASGMTVEDISTRTLPRDFERSARQHRCYLMRKQ